MKKIFAMIVSVGMLLGSQAVYAENIGAVDFNQISKPSTAAFAGERLATVNVKNAPDFKTNEFKQSDVNLDAFLASNHNLIPEKAKVGTSLNKPGLDLRSHNLYYLALLD